MADPSQGERVIQPQDLEGRRLVDVEGVAVGRVFSCGRAATGELVCVVDLDDAFQARLGTGRTEALFRAHHVTGIEGENVRINMPGREVLKE